jgi:hypothetical protein
VYVHSAEEFTRWQAAVALPAGGDSTAPHPGSTE